MYWSPNFLAVVFKKQEISQQVVIRMQDLASEFSKIFRGHTPGPSQPEGATPSRTQLPARPLAGRGAQAAWCWDPNLGPLNFSAVCMAAPLTRNNFPGPLSLFYAAHWLLVWRQIVSKSTI